MIYLLRTPEVVLSEERRAILGLDDDVDAFMCVRIYNRSKRRIQVEEFQFFLVFGFVIFFPISLSTRHKSASARITHTHKTHGEERF